MVTDRFIHQDDNLVAMINEEECPPSQETSGATGRVTPGAPEGWCPPGPQADWKGPSKLTGIKVPAFEDVDNPGG